MIGTDLKKGTTTTQFSGEHPDGERALVQRSKDADYAQFNRIGHPHCYGWWKYPLNTFKEIKL